MTQSTLTNEVTARIQGFLRERFQNYEFGEDENIFETGLVNSLAAMQLVLHFEKEFAIEIGDEDLSLDNFRTVRTMTQLIGRKLAK